MSGRYVDIPSIVQVIGAVYQNPMLLDDDKYSFSEDDFTEDFHKVIFGSIYNLHQLGAKKIDGTNIEDYLQQRPKKLAVYKANNGAEYLQKIQENVQTAAFDYYYKRMKKMTLFRMYKEKVGMDLSWLYDIDNIFDQKKKQKQEDWLDNTPIEKIAELIDGRIDQIKAKYIDNADSTFYQAGDGAEELFDNLQKYPEIGIPLYGALSNAVTRGARLGKLYLRSARTGVGKSRAMIADVCTVGCSELYVNGSWQANGTQEPCIYISTEQQLDEIQTMMWAFVSDVPEDHILYNKYEPGEIERIQYAITVIENSPIQIKLLPDFSMQDIENAIKFGVREYGARYVFHDYIHSSIKILSEISGKAKVEGLKEYNILFMIAVRLKDLANEYGVFIETATQLNGMAKDSDIQDENLLSGAKSIATKIDLGEIIADVTEKDIKSLEDVLKRNGLPNPDTKISIYKNRRGKYKGVYLWCQSNKGVCKITPYFVTDWSYNFIDVPYLAINTVPAKEG